MPLIFVLALCALLPLSSPAQARCLPHFQPLTGDLRLHCAPEFWERGPAYGPLRTHLRLEPPESWRRAEADPASPSGFVAKRSAQPAALRA